MGRLSFEVTYELNGIRNSEIVNTPTSFEAQKFIENRYGPKVLVVWVKEIRNY